MTGEKRYVGLFTTLILLSLFAAVLVSLPPGAAQTTGTVVDTQVFTTSGTWTKPLDAITIHVMVLAGGGGGGGGANTLSAVILNGPGGGGGGGGAMIEDTFLADDLNATESVTVGLGGAGGTGGA